MLDDDLETPRVFFSYSYRASEELKPLFRRACVETGVSPVFADEVRLGESARARLKPNSFVFSTSSLSRYNTTFLLALILRSHLSACEGMGRFSVIWLVLID